MAWDYDALINDLNTHYGLARYHHLQMNVEITAAWMDWNVPDDHACLQDVIQCLEAARDAFVDILHKGYYGWNGATFPLISALNRDKACPFITEAPEYEFTMGKLINTMLTAMPDEVTYFVGLVDAYRQSVWNQPFNQEFFAGLARGFEQWP